MPDPNTTYDYRDLPAVLDILGAAAILDVHPDTIRNWMKSGELRAVKLGRLWRIPRHELLRALGVEPPTAANTAAREVAP